MSNVWDHFSSARWFSGKGRGGVLSSITPLDPYVSRGGDDPLTVRSEIASISYPDGGEEQYQLLISYRPVDRAGDPLPGAIEGAVDPVLGQAHDALSDPEALELFVAAVASNSDVSSSWTSMVRQPDRLSGPVRVFTGEQSNTNLMVGDSALLKLFRKLEPGRNLDTAIHDALGRAQVHSAAELYGWVEAQVPIGAQEMTTDLAMAVEQFAEARDGWDLAVESAAGSAEGADFSAAAAELGGALAQVHRALADTFPASRVEGDEVADTMAGRLDRAIAVAPALAEHRDGLLALFERLRGQELNTQQIHGDFHLGQVLHTAHGWRVIDFEGEPMKSRAERWSPDSKWRDVAGLVRSFGYAASGAPDPLSASTQQWVDGATAAFLDAYSPGRSPEQLAVLLAYEADKAIYEVVYETRNRPDWLPIPLRAITRLSRLGHDV